VILLVFRFFASLNPSAILLGGRQQTEQVEEVVVNVDVVVPTKRGKKAKRVVVKPPSLYTPALLDTTLHNFLSITEPSHLPLLPSPVAANPPLKIPTSLPLSEWTQLLTTDTLAVLQHPSTKTLYAICATFPDVQLRQLFETLTQVGNRTKWDAMASGTSFKYIFLDRVLRRDIHDNVGAEEIDQIEVGGRRGSVSWLAMKGVAVIKAKVSRFYHLWDDFLCLLSEFDRTWYYCQSLPDYHKQTIHRYDCSVLRLHLTIPICLLSLNTIEWR
jgi:hypothetical protein